MYVQEYEANSNVITQGETGLLFKFWPLILQRFKWLYLTTVKCQKLVAPVVHIT
jgi:hypothetical protein